MQGISRETIIGYISFKTLIFIFSMQIIIYFATQDMVLEYITLKLIYITKGNRRLIFYMICIFTAGIVAFIEDLTLSLILVPIIYRACKILRIPAGTYMMGMTITINIGAILTPVSSLKNLIIGNEFGWGFSEYLINMGPLFLATLISTICLMDRFILKKEQEPEEMDKEMFSTMLDPKKIIEDEKCFYATSIILFSTFVLMFLGFEPALVTTISAGILILFHYKSFEMSDLNNEISWKIIITFAILFILSNSLTTFGFSEAVSTGLLDVINDNIFLAVLLTLLISTLLSAFLAGTPVTIILLPIVAGIVNQGLFPNPIIIAFIGGVNLAGNFLPQGSACDLMTLNLAKKYNVKNLDYNRLLKNGSVFASLHFLLILGYTFLYTLILS